MNRVTRYGLILAGIAIAGLLVIGTSLSRPLVYQSALITNPATINAATSQLAALIPTVTFTATSPVVVMMPSATFTPVGRPSYPKNFWWDIMTDELKTKPYVTVIVSMRIEGYNELADKYKAATDQNNLAAANAVRVSEIALSDKARADLLTGLAGYQYTVVADTQGINFAPEIFLQIDQKTLNYLDSLPMVITVGEQGRGFNEIGK